MDKEVKRVFLGIPLNAEYSNLLQQFIDSNTNMNIRWVKSKNWHLTCLFIGEVDVNNIPNLENKIAEVLQSVPAFQLTVERFSFMPAARPRMLWLRFFKHNEFSRLNLLLAKALINKTLDRQPIPHVTLSRFKHPPKAHMLSVHLPENTLPAREITLFESKLYPTGAEYIPLRTWKLQ